jgi:Fic family protein
MPEVSRQMPKRRVGRYERVTVGGEKVDAFIPFNLPPARPALIIDAKLEHRLQKAEQALRRLDLAGDMVPSLDWFIYAFVRKEAVVSSQIEGTQASLVDLLAFEAEEHPHANADVEEVTNYLDALAYARRQLESQGGLPLSVRLLNEAHKRLMRGVRGASKRPGEIRRSQNWIGGSRAGKAIYVPPPPDKLVPLLSAFEKYIHANDRLPKLVRTGLLHAQFETIHPYPDGNGRIGRLMIALLLEHWGFLKAPLLYLSLFFKRHREEYYQRLNLVRLEGDWEGWIDFFLDGVATICNEGISSARELFNLLSTDRTRLLGTESASVSALRLFERLPRYPIVTVASTIKLLETSKPTATRAIEMLTGIGILVEMTGKKRDRSFAYRAYMERLRTGTELDVRR